MIVHEQTDRAGTTAEQYLCLARRNLPVVNRVLEAYGDAPLADYVKGFIRQPAPCFQPRDDLCRALQQETEPLLGEAVARRAARDLAESPVVLTVNHHGVDSLSQSIQGNLIFSLNALCGAAASRTFCIFSCGNIPLNNLEYPRGLLLYHLHPGRGGLTRKFPLFPDRLKRCMVSAAPAFDQAMLGRAISKLDRMARDGEVPQASAESLHKLLREEYGMPSVVALPTYSQQSVVLNHRIWKRLFNKPVTPPDVVNVEFERIASSLLRADLSNAESLAGCVMFDPELRQNVIEGLDGIKGCWRTEDLATLQDPSRRGQKAAAGCGTVFFWGVDRNARRVPLHLRSGGSAGKVLLYGVDDQGHAVELPFTPRSVMKGLCEGLLLPSLFTCFLTLSFARGVVCVGGYFQGEYLPAMQRGLVAAMERTAGYQAAAQIIAAVASGQYLSAMLAVMIRADADHLIPAGPVEVLAGGGITSGDIDRVRQLTVREAHLAGLFETVPDAVPQALRPAGWELDLARDCNTLLHGRVVVKC